MLFKEGRTQERQEICVRRSGDLRPQVCRCKQTKWSGWDIRNTSLTVAPRITDAGAVAQEQALAIVGAAAGRAALLRPLPVLALHAFVAEPQPSGYLWRHAWTESTVFVVVVYRLLLPGTIHSSINGVLDA